MLNRLPADERRAQLVESAMGIAERGGVSSVTIRAVAEDAGVSLGVVHYCFESKEALVAAMGEALVLQLSQALRYAFGQARTEEAQSGPRGLRELLHSGLSAMWPIIEATPNRQLLTYEITAYGLRQQAAGAELAGSIAAKQYATMDAEAVEFLERSVEHVGMRWTEPVGHLATFALAVIDGIVLRWLVERDSEAVIAELDDLVQLVTGKAVEV
ncbi:Tetr family transcriptional regulator [Rhodococcus sp. RD6.2]|jgi:AcrR family transcriptional regulator|uniref:TetR/AcrR family transcriptional regulator n=1 Tax=Rhodococcus sp. RD6.2 TaxID=260936 RepID=UPI00063B5104|nr:TetR/AcrR family transcriptional regulator [Rhodococcus sp. RD6.2]CRK49878.1 Tetr family transcriptional regulator [Rhodococcus sp. RD6.2]